MAYAAACFSASSRCSGDRTWWCATAVAGAGVSRACAPNADAIFSSGGRQPHPHPRPSISQHSIRRSTGRELRGSAGESTHRVRSGRHHCRHGCRAAARGEAAFRPRRRSPCCVIRSDRISRRRGGGADRGRRRGVVFRRNCGRTATVAVRAPEAVVAGAEDFRLLVLARRDRAGRAGAVFGAGDASPLGGHLRHAAAVVCR